MSSIEEIKNSLQESLAAGLDKSIDEANLKAVDILSKTGDYTNPRYWYQSGYHGHMIRLMTTRSSTNHATAANDGDKSDRPVFTADEQTLRNLKNLDELDRELRKSYQQSSHSQKPRGRVGKKSKKGKLAWRRRQTWPQSSQTTDSMANVSGPEVTVSAESESVVDSVEQEPSQTTLAAGDRVNIPSPISTEMEQYRLAKSQAPIKDQGLETEDVLEAYNRKPTTKVDTLPNIHAHFLPREQRASNGKQNANGSSEERNGDAILPAIEIDVRKSIESQEHDDRSRTKKRVRHRPVQREESERVQLPIIDDLVRVRELRKMEPSNLSEADRKNREYVNGWIHKLNKGTSGKTRAKKENFQSELKKNLDPGMYKTGDEKKDNQNDPKPNHVLMLPDNPLAPLPKKYPELTKNGKPFAGMYFHTLRQKSAYQLKLKQMNKYLKQIKKKEVPRNLSSSSSSTSDFNSKFSKVENRIDAIGTEIGKLYHSTVSLQKIVNREPLRSKSEATSNHDDLFIDATPLSPVKKEEYDEQDEQTTIFDQDGGGRYETENNMNGNNSVEENKVGLADAEHSDAAKKRARDDWLVRDPENMTNQDIVEDSADDDEDRTITKYDYVNDKIVAKETTNSSKLSVVTLEMEKSQPPGVNSKDYNDSAKSSVFAMATTHNETADLKEEEGSEEAVSRLLPMTRKAAPGSPIKEPMTKFNKLEPFNEKNLNSENDNKPQRSTFKQTTEHGEASPENTGNNEGSDVTNNSETPETRHVSAVGGTKEAIRTKTGEKENAENSEMSIKDDSAAVSSDDANGTSTREMGNNTSDEREQSNINGGKSVKMDEISHNEGPEEKVDDGARNIRDASTGDDVIVDDRRSNANLQETSVSTDNTSGVSRNDHIDSGVLVNKQETEVENNRHIADDNQKKAVSNENVIDKDGSVVNDDNNAENDNITAENKQENKDEDDDDSNIKQAEDA
ncbi:enolase-phosphatase E1-like [Ptychodera flava]|uniref:enolase-phosphatase E1-like n=1 Tax=Ptychodera flava TaxID=63121 RepID=UPI00396A1206